ncbi:adenylate cyclase type 10 isoform X2 [Phthorimaea operculella]|nr:adenylate cyclase type 10 isoform X2 [Phthorimaea operculella]
MTPSFPWFTELCESYTKSGCGGPSKLTEVLNSYIGAMVQEILTHKGDVLKFSGDSFLSMWKKSPKMTMHDVVHTAIDCGLIIQKNYATHVTDLGITLKVKVAISAGVSHFAMIGSEPKGTYIIVGKPVWDVKAAEYMSHAGDVLTSSSIWAYVNEGEYCTQPCGDGRHTKVLGVGVTWKRVEKIDFASTLNYNRDLSRQEFVPSSQAVNTPVEPAEDTLEKYEAAYKEYSLRPAVISALRGSWWPALRRFMLNPVLRAVDNEEPMDFLTEVRHVVVVFLNIITKAVSEDVLVDIVDGAYNQVCNVTMESGGLVNKVSMFDKDMMFLVLFGLRGFKHEDEAQNALLCAIIVIQAALYKKIRRKER